MPRDAIAFRGFFQFRASLLSLSDTALSPKQTCFKTTLFRRDTLHLPTHDMNSHLAYFRPTGLTGVELLHARYERQSFSRHSHDGYALGVIEAGALGFRYLRRDLVAGPGEVNLVVPGECHDGRPAGGTGWTYRMFYLAPEVLGQAAAELDLGRGLPDFAAGVLHDPVLAQTIRLTHNRLSDAGSGTLEKQSLMTRLLTCWIRRHAEERGTLPRLGPEPRAVSRAREFLAARFHADPSLADVAQAAHLSPFHLLRVFARATGQTPHEFLIQKRIDAARNLLASDLSLARIAAECGFADQSHMTRLFRRQHGITPGRYRKILLNRPDQSL